MSNLLQDLQFALRRLRRSPSFAITGISILALGVAANVIVFGVLQAMILQPLNLPQADRLITFAPREGAYPIFSYPEVRDVRDENTVFSTVAAEAIQVFGLEANGATAPVWGSEVSGQYFEATGIKPFLGRLLQRSDDEQPDKSQAAVVSWYAWNGRFGADKNIVGKVVRIDKRPYTIVGVTPKGFYGTEKFLQVDLFVPIANEASLEGANWLEDRNTKLVFPLARIKDGVTLAQAQGQLDAIATRVARNNPKEEAGVLFKSAPAGLVGNFVRGAARRFLAGVMILATIVLLAACANLGGLFAARTADRSRELAIRLAIGSSRGRIMRQVLLEALIVSVAGAACAGALSWLALAGLAGWHPPSDYPIRFQIDPQPSLLVVAFLISMAAGMVFGLMPLQQIFKTDPNDAIKAGGGQVVKGQRWALRDVLLSAQVALCCITVTAAFVSLRGLSKAMSTDIGIRAKDATLTKFDLSQAGYTGTAAEQLQQQLQTRMANLAGVEAVGYSNGTPLADSPSTSVFTQQATDFRASKEAFDTYDYSISPGYLAAAGTPLLEGRDITSADSAKAPRVALVNQKFGQSLFHTDHTVGRYFKNRDGVSIQIVGVVANGKYFLTSEEPQEAAYFPILQQPTTNTSLLVRTHPDASGASAKSMTETIRKTIAEADPAIPIRASGTWESQLMFSFFPAQVATVALGMFGAFGLLLSITGTFGLASYTVTKRMRELSIRVALGAQVQQILSNALGRLLKLIGIGAGLGTVLGLSTSRLLSHIVYQASAQDPLVVGGVLITILVTGCLSVAGPVRRLLHVDPAHLLREQ